MERRVVVMWLRPEDLPPIGDARVLSLPDDVNGGLNDEGWRVVSHQVVAADLSGNLMLTLYAEK